MLPIHHYYNAVAGFFLRPHRENLNNFSQQWQMSLCFFNWLSDNTEQLNKRIIGIPVIKTLFLILIFFLPALPAVFGCPAIIIHRVFNGHLYIL